MLLVLFAHYYFNLNALALYSLLKITQDLFCLPNVRPWKAVLKERIVKSGVPGSCNQKEYIKMTQVNKM